VSDQPPQPPRPVRPPRAETPEVIALKLLKEGQPDLALAVDMQIALVDMERRMRTRLTLPWISAEDSWLQEQEKAGRALVRFGDIPIDWTDFRLIFRQIAVNILLDLHDTSTRLLAEVGLRATADPDQPRAKNAAP